MTRQYNIQMNTIRQIKTTVCSFDLSYPLLEKENFIKKLYIVVLICLVLYLIDAI